MCVPALLHVDQLPVLAELEVVPDRNEYQKSMNNHEQTFMLVPALLQLLVLAELEVVPDRNEYQKSMNNHEQTFMLVPALLQLLVLAELVVLALLHVAQLPVLAELEGMPDMNNHEHIHTHSFGCLQCLRRFLQLCQRYSRHGGCLTILR